MLSALAALGTVYVCGLASGFHEPGLPVKFLVADDSMISLRIAHNFASHLGPYFNAGERTAANTSLFWPIAISPVFKIFSDLGRAVLALSVISALLTALTVGLVTYYAETVSASIAATVTLLVLPGFAAYGSSIMEHVPQTLFVTLGFLVLLGRIKRFAGLEAEGCLVLFSLAFLMRPDTLPLMVPIAASVVMRRSENKLMAYASLAFAVATLVLYYALHHWFYGTFVPNTFHLKVRFGMGSIMLGTRYVVFEALSSGVSAVLFALFTLFMIRREIFNSSERITLLALLMQLAYIAAVGGDVLLYGRFFLILSPITAMLFWEKFFRMEHGPNFARQSLVRAVAIFCLFAIFFCNLRRYVETNEVQVVIFHGGYVVSANDQFEDGTIIAEYIRRHVTPEDGQIGLFALGGLSYYLPEYLGADFLGKADPVIANEPVKWGPIGHNKWDIPYTLQTRHVSVIPFVPEPESQARHDLAVHTDFGFVPAFQLDDYLRRHYTYRSPQELGSPGIVGLYIRNDLLDRFPQVSAD